MPPTGDSKLGLTSAAPKGKGKLGLTSAAPKGKGKLGLTSAAPKGKGNQRSPKREGKAGVDQRSPKREGKAGLDQRSPKREGKAGLDQRSPKREGKAGLDQRSPKREGKAGLDQRSPKREGKAGLDQRSPKREGKAEIMSYTKCLDAKVAAGRMTAKGAATAKAKYAAYVEKARRDGHPDPDRMARDEVTADMHFEAYERARRLDLITERGSEILKRMDSEGSRYEGAKLTLDKWHGEANSHNQLARGMLLDGLRTMNKGGKAQKNASAHDVVRELFEEGSVPGAAHIAKGWRQATDFLTDAYVEAGGQLKKRKDWNLPQTHSADAIDKVSVDEWIDFVLPKLDLDRMGELSQGRPFTQEELIPILADVHQTLRTGGLSKFVPSASGGGGKSVAMGHTDSRFLQFKDADGWLAYNETYGKGNVLEGMIDYIDTMSSDIGAMRALGPNPAAMKNFINGYIKQGVADAPPGKAAKFQRKAKGDIHKIDGYFDVLSGAASEVVDARIAKIGSELRAWMGASQLGSATVSALSDVATMTITAQMNGVPKMKMLGRMAQQLASEASQETAARAGFIGDRFVAGLRETRWNMDIMEASYGAKVLDKVIRYSALKTWTDSAREAFTLEFSGALADGIKKNFAGLSKDVRGGLEKNGFTKADWDALRGAANAIQEPEPGAKFIDFISLVRSDDKDVREAAIKLHGVILKERDYAVVNPGAGDEAMAWRLGLRGGKRGTWAGEFQRTAFGMYKSFPVSFMTTHIGRALAMKTGWGKLTYGATLVAMMTPFGMLRYQFDQMVWGRDPISMDPTTEKGRKAWGAAVLRGGGLTILGDLLFAPYDRFGHGPFSTISGPGVGLAEDIAKLTLGNLRQWSDGKETHFLRESIETARKYIPGGNIWFLRMAFQRAVLDQLTLLADPSVRRKWSKREQKYQQNYKSGTWWRLGEFLPNRAPDWANAIGG